MLCCQPEPRTQTSRFRHPGRKQRLCPSSGSTCGGTWSCPEEDREGWAALCRRTAASILLRVVPLCNEPSVTLQVPWERLKLYGLNLLNLEKHSGAWRTLLFIYFPCLLLLQTSKAAPTETFSLQSFIKWNKLKKRGQMCSRLSRFKLTVPLSSATLWEFWVINVYLLLLLHCALLIPNRPPLAFWLYSFPPRQPISLLTLASQL